MRRTVIREHKTTSFIIYSSKYVPCILCFMCESRYCRIVVEEMTGGWTQSLEGEANG